MLEANAKGMGKKRHSLYPKDPQIIIRTIESRASSAARPLRDPKKLQPEPRSHNCFETTEPTPAKVLSKKLIRNSSIEISQRYLSSLRPASSRPPVNISEKKEMGFR